jgi:hypothetical protein
MSVSKHVIPPFLRHSPMPKLAPPPGHAYHPWNCAHREVCYGCSNCEPEYWKEHYPEVYANFFNPPSPSTDMEAKL